MSDGLANGGLDAAPQDPLDLDAGLRLLGHDTFRTGQREAVETLLEARRLLLVAPTGRGKSLVYQLPAALLPGTTLVISPLVALMHDQVAQLEVRGIASTYLAATLSREEVARRTAEIAKGSYQLVYVAPERLVTPGFRALLRDLDCPLLAVDEAHCISSWGHDFRPEYLQIGELVAELSRARVLACTATATPVVRDEILERLRLPPDTAQAVHGFARPNLSLRASDVRGGAERQHRVDAALAEALGGPGQGRGTAIVYAATRRGSEAEAERLASAGWRAEAYHAGLEGDHRNAVQKRFMAGDLEVVAATNAFGMGIDRPDVRAVIHLAPPSSLEAYYQEVGRAGRDGDPALGLLLCGAGDLGSRRALLERDAEGNADLLRHKWNLFLELMRWAEGGSCRHDAVLRYFGDEAETLDGCGRCDVCQGLDAGVSDPDEVDLVVRKALSAVARIHGRFGLLAAAKLLRGTADDRLARTGLDRTPTFGVLADRSEDWIQRLLRRCVAAGFVDFDGGDRPVVGITLEGQAVMRGDRPSRMLLPPDAAAPVPRARGKRAAVPDEALDPAAEALFESLRHWRLERSRELGVPPYVVASDRTLREVARSRPATREDLLLLHGIGPSKAQKFGDALLQAVREASA